MTVMNAMIENFDRPPVRLLLQFIVIILVTQRVGGTFVFAADGPKPKAPTMAGVLAASKPGDWRVLDPENTLYVEFASGRVVIELAPTFAPQHVANVKALAREHYYDGLAVVRVQDNYVVQWADPEAEKPALARKIQHAKKTLPGEFERPLDPKLPFTRLTDGDVYAREVGFSGGFPVARDPRTGRMWLVHGYGMLGAGRDNAADSGAMVAEAVEVELQAFRFHQPVAWDIVDHDMGEVGLPGHRADRGEFGRREAHHIKRAGMPGRNPF